MSDVKWSYDTEMETRKWANEIPTIKFPSDWGVKIIPPFAGASVRFIVEKNDASVSVYLDCYDNLGYFGKPYWEIYPYDEDTFRCAMNETELLLSYIEESINSQLNEE